MQANEASEGLFAELQRTANSCPNAVALRESEAEITYCELVDSIDRFSAMLATCGVNAGDRVGVLLRNGSPFVITTFALWSLGAIPVCLNVRYRPYEIARYFNDCNVETVISSVDLEPNILALGGLKAHISSLWLWGEGEPRHLEVAASRSRSGVPAQQTLDGGACTQYSTGSTGRSKRVTRTHRQVIEEVKSVRQVLAYGPDDKIIGTLPFYHAYGLIGAMLSPLLSGSSIHVVHEFFPRDVAAIVEKHGITGMAGAPMMYASIIDLGHGFDLTSLRFAISGGAPLPTDIRRKFYSQFGVALRQQYGCTETGVATIEAEPATDASMASVGSPFPGVSVRILDDAGKPVRDGVTGNIAISSPFAADGYDVAESGSESSFRSGNFLPGDIGYLENGKLMLAGRKRNFINVAGNKVDPVEVETVLLDLPGVSEVVVVGLDDGAAGQRVKAVIVSEDRIPQNVIFAHCSRRLADFKIPRVVEYRDELPRSPLGKILRKDLIDNASIDN